MSAESNKIFLAKLYLSFQKFWSVFYLLILGNKFFYPSLGGKILNPYLFPSKKVSQEKEKNEPL